MAKFKRRIAGKKNFAYQGNINMPLLFSSSEQSKNNQKPKNINMPPLFSRTILVIR